MLLDYALDNPSSCRQCNALCCRSFPTVELKGDEFRELQSLGASRLQLSLFGPHKLIIEHGCEFLHESRCGIYDHRPSICRRFICKP